MNKQHVLYLLCMCLPGDVRVTRLVIFGALLGVLDPVLTLAAAESSTHDLMRMPNQAMVQQLAADSADDSYRTAQATAGGSGVVGANWIEQARSMLDEQRQKLAPGVASDHEITLAVFKVRTYSRLNYPVALCNAAALPHSCPDT